MNIDDVANGGVADEDKPYVDAVHVWFRGALLVNSGLGAFSELIRSYTGRQLALHIGGVDRDSVEGFMQEASNEIGQLVIEGGILGVDNGILQPLDVIADRDAERALELVFRDINAQDSARDPGAVWSGSILFSMFSQPGVPIDDKKFWFGLNGSPLLL